MSLEWQCSSCLVWDSQFARSLILASKPARCLIQSWINCLRIPVYYDKCNPTPFTLCKRTKHWRNKDTKDAAAHFARLSKRGAKYSIWERLTVTREAKLLLHEGQAGGWETVHWLFLHRTYCKCILQPERFMGWMVKDLSCSGCLPAEIARVPSTTNLCFERTTAAASVSQDFMCENNMKQAVHSPLFYKWQSLHSKRHLETTNSLRCSHTDMPPEV